MLGSIPSYQSVRRLTARDLIECCAVLGSEEAVSTALLHWDHTHLAPEFPTRVRCDRTGNKSLKPTVVWFPDAHSYKKSPSVSEPPAQ